MRVCVRARVWPTTRGPQTFSRAQVKRGDGVGRLGEEKEEREKKKTWPRCHTAPRLNRLEDRCVLCREIHVVFTLAVPSDCDIMVAVSLLLLDCQSPGPPARSRPPKPPILMNGSEAEPRDDGMERVRKPQPPPLDRSFLLKVVKTHLRDPHHDEGAVLQNGLRGRKSTNSACSSWTVCGIDVREGQRKKPRHQSACRLSGIEPAGTSF